MSKINLGNVTDYGYSTILGNLDPCYQEFINPDLSLTPKAKSLISETVAEKAKDKDDYNEEIWSDLKYFRNDSVDVFMMQPKVAYEKSPLLVTVVKGHHRNIDLFFENGHFYVWLSKPRCGNTEPQYKYFFN